MNKISTTNSNSNLTNINLNAEEIALNNIKVAHTREYSKGIPTTPNRPSRNIFGKPGYLPSNVPPTPNPIRRLTRWKEKKNKECKKTNSSKSTRRMKRK